MKKIGVIFLFSILILCCLIPIIGASATQEYEASVVISTPSGETEYTGTYLEMRSKVNTAMTSATVDTTVYLRLHKDVTLTSKSIALSGTSSQNAHLVFDLQGYDLTIDTTEFGSNFIHYNNVGSISLLGFNHELGEGKSKIVSRSRAGFIYNPAANTNTSVNIENIDFVFTNMALGYCDDSKYPNQPMFNLTAGEISFLEVNVLFTGEDAYAIEGSTGGADISKLRVPFIQANGTATINLDICEFKDVNTKGIQTYGIYAAGATTKVIPLVNKFDAYYTLNQSNLGAYVHFIECELTAKNTIFYGSGKVDVTDSHIYAENCNLTAGNITANFIDENNASRIYAEEIPAGKYTTPEGYDFRKTNLDFFILSNLSKYSTAKLPAYFGDGMVFQRGEPITVKGTCDTNGNTVTVKLGDATATATVSGREWSVTFPAMEATTGLTLSVYEVEPEYSTETVYGDIAVGDVFILSGQSNMDYQAKYLEDYEEFLANADNFDNLRGFLVPNAYRHGEDKIGAGKWCELSSDNIGDFSAIGYVMATKLAAELSDVTVAIVDATYPGSIAKTWIDIETYREHFGVSHADVATYEAYLAFYKANGRCPNAQAELGSAWIGKSYQQVVASCYDAMIAFFDGYSAKAAVWYQGEGDLGRVSTYTAYYKALTDSFRKTFNNDKLPFAVIQLAPYSTGTSIDNFRAMQATLTSIDPYTYVVATSNEGAIFNDAEFINNSSLSLVFVHTSVKSPIGLNTADVILDKVYNLDGANKTLELVSAKHEGSSVVLIFNQPLLTGGVDEVLGFEIADANGTFKAAEAIIDGNKVTLTANGITAPKSVRYGFGSFYIEYQDGTVVIPMTGYDYKNTGSMTSSTVTFCDINGKYYTINKDSDEVLRSCIPGNVTSETGAPLGVFSIAVD